MLCALGAAILAAAIPPILPPREGWRSAAGLVVGFAAGSAGFSLERMPDAGMLGVVAAIASAWLLARSDGRLFAALVAGVLAGAYGVLLRAQGTPAWLAVALAAAILVAVALLTRSGDRFLPSRVRDEALLGLVIASVVVAMLPGVLDGWRAAAGLNLEATSVPATSVVAVPSWTLMLGGAALAAGAGYSVWSRR